MHNLLKIKNNELLLALFSNKLRKIEAENSFIVYLDFFCF